MQNNITIQGGGLTWNHEKPKHNGSGELATLLVPRSHRGRRMPLWHHGSGLQGGVPAEGRAFCKTAERLGGAEGFHHNRYGSEFKPCDLTKKYQQRHRETKQFQESLRNRRKSPKIPTCLKAYPTRFNTKRKHLEIVWGKRTRAPPQTPPFTWGVSRPATSQVGLRLSID